MTILTRPKAALPYPQADEFIKDVNDHIRRLAQKLDDLVVMRFTTQAAMAAVITAPVAGQLVYLTTDKVFQIYDGTGWRRINVASPQIYSGTVAPATSTGVAGDIYVQYV